MISIYFVLLFAALTSANINKVPSNVRFYSNIAEIIQPLNQLPLEFSGDQWDNIRPDSITLFGKNLKIALQTITEKKTIHNGTEIYIRSPLSSDKTTIKLIKAILIDESTNLVKVEDDSIINKRPLYFTVSQDQIFYPEEPIKSRYLVDFKYNAAKDSKVFVSYLQSNINWRTSYQLNMHDNENELIVMANIRNDGISSVAIDRGELIGGDINLQTQRDDGFRQVRLTAQLGSAAPITGKADASDDATPSVDEGKELTGLYVFPITKPFTIESKTNYLLPMFRPELSLDRYGLISKSFVTVTNKGKAQRSYRLTSNRYLSQGNCILREQDRIVGETTLPNLAAKDKYEFSIGEDADIIYKENVKLISSKSFNETEARNDNSGDKHTPELVIVPRRQYVYEIHVELENFKDHPVNIEYEQTEFNSYQTVRLLKSQKDLFIQDGSTLKAKMMLSAHTRENYYYTIELVR